jgi:hypothetical protein
LELAKWVRRLQNFEKEKLQRTVILHVERKRLAHMEAIAQKSEHVDSPAASSHSCAHPVETEENSDDEFATAIQV